MKKINSHYQVGGQDKPPYSVQLAPPPLQLRVWYQTAKKTAQFDLDYDYKWYNFMYRKFETSEMSIKKK